MEKQLITVKEYIELGGEMYKGECRRKLFYPNGIEFNCCIKSLYDDIISNQSEDYFVKVDSAPVINTPKIGDEENMRKAFWLSIKHVDSCLFSRRNGHQGWLIGKYSVCLRLFNSDIL